MLGKFSCWCFSPLWLVICQWKTVWVVVDIVTGVGQVWLTLSMWARDPGGWVRTVARGPLCLWSAGQWSSWQKVQWEVGCVLLSQDLQALSLVGEVGARGQAGDCALQAPQLLPGPPLARPRLWGSRKPLLHPCPCDLIAAATCIKCICGIWPREATNWDMPPLSQVQDPGRWKLCLWTFPFLVRTENNVHLVEVYRNMDTWSWPDLKNKGSDTKKFATTNHAHPSPFL